MIVRKQSIDDPKLKWFQESRIGLFIHFGLYSILARGEQIFGDRRVNMSRAKYESLRKHFNPHLFSARAWVDHAESMGAHYITITAKHLDGFCLFDSALTDYKITNTPFGRDLIGELIAECHKRSMRICLYYSRVDWHHRNYAHNPPSAYSLVMPLPDQKPDWGKYMEYFTGQIRELCTKYGRIDGVWFDAYGPSLKGDPSPKYLYDLIKKYQPGAAINDRNGYGDFFTPERRLADNLSEYLHETCQAMGWEWGYVADTPLFSGPFLLQSLAHVVGHGGNFLLNIGPKTDGTFPADRIERMKIIGRWLKKNGEAIYGAKPVMDLNAIGKVRAGNAAISCFTTRRNRNLYLLLPEWPKEDKITISGLRTSPVSILLCGSDKDILLRSELDNSGLSIKGLPAMPVQEGVNMLKLVFSKEPQIAPHAVRPPVINVAASRMTLLPAELAERRGRGRKGALIPIDFETEDAQYPQAVKPDKKIHGALLGMTTDQEAVWRVNCESAGKYRIAVNIRCPAEQAGGEYIIAAAGCRLTRIVRKSPGTGKPVKIKTQKPRVSHQLFVPWSDISLYGFQNAGFLYLPEGYSRITLKPGRKGLRHTAQNPGGKTLTAHVRCLRLIPARKRST